MDETQSRLAKGDPKLRDRLDELFDGLMNLRATYQLTRVDRNPGERDVTGGAAASAHEDAVQVLFGQLQDIRLEVAGTDPNVDGALDFLEICLAEMR